LSLANSFATPKRSIIGALSWIVLGLIVGLIAKWITSGYEPKRCIVTIVIGVVGAAMGGWVGRQLGLGTASGFDLRSLALAITGKQVSRATWAAGIG
jgi:uncharacterized membrane protein YeaQ/YmgE (transglycosylase-associated protein family)